MYHLKTRLYATHHRDLHTFFISKQVFYVEIGIAQVHKTYTSALFNMHVQKEKGKV